MPYRANNSFKRRRSLQDNNAGRKSEHPYLSAKRKYFKSELDEVDKEIVEVIKNVGAERFGKLFNHNEEATHLFRPKKRASDDDDTMFDNDDSGAFYPSPEAGAPHSSDGITNPCDAIFRTFMADHAAREDRQRCIAQEARERVCALESATRHKKDTWMRTERERTHYDGGSSRGTLSGDGACRTQAGVPLRTPDGKSSSASEMNDDACTRDDGGDVMNSDAHHYVPEASELDAQRLAAEIMRDAAAVACVPVATLSLGGEVYPITSTPELVVDSASAPLTRPKATKRHDTTVALMCEVDSTASPRQMTCSTMEKEPIAALDILRDDRCYVETGRDNFHIEVAALKGADEERVPRNQYWQTTLGNGAASSSSSNSMGFGALGNAGGRMGNQVDNRPPHLLQQQGQQGQQQGQQEGHMQVRAGWSPGQLGQRMMLHGQQSQQQTQVADEWNRNQQYQQMQQQQQMQNQQYQQMQQQPQQPEQRMQQQMPQQPQQVPGANEWNQNQCQPMQQQLERNPQLQPQQIQEAREGNQDQYQQIEQQQEILGTNAFHQNQYRQMPQQLQQMQGGNGWNQNQHQQVHQQPQQPLLQMQQQPCQQPQRMHGANEWNQNQNQYQQMQMQQSLQQEPQWQVQQIQGPHEGNQDQQLQQQQEILGANEFHQNQYQQMQQQIQIQGENGWNQNQHRQMEQQQMSGTSADHQNQHPQMQQQPQPEQMHGANGWNKNQNQYQQMQHQPPQQISVKNEWSHQQQQQPEQVQAGIASNQNHQMQQPQQENTNQSNHIQPQAPDHIQPQAPNHIQPQAPDHIQPQAPDHIQVSYRSSPTTIITSRAADTNCVGGRQMPLWAHGLDPSQLSAAAASFDQCQIVSAGPGAGKTHYLVARTLRYKMEHPKHGVACVTFSREIAGEVDDRIRTALKQLKLPSDNLFCGTIHRLALRIVRTFSQELGFGDWIRMANKKELESALKSALAHSNNVSRGQNWADMAEDVSDDEMDDEHTRKILNRLRRMQKFPEFRAQQDAEIQQIYMTFKEIMQQKCLIDVNDLIPLATRAFQFPIAQQWASEFLSYLLVDEFQDTDCAQIELFRRITDRCITVVGDEDQMIYGWRMSKEGFDSTNPFEIFEKLFFNSQVHCLERNYRSPPEIVEVSNKLMRLAANRRSDKTSTSMLPSAPDSVRCVVKHTVDKEIEWIIEQMRVANMPWSTFAILTRLNKIKDYIERKLRDQGIPTKGPKIKKWEPECVCFLGYLKIAADRQDDKAFLEIYNAPKRGLGKKFIEQLDKMPGACYYQKAKNLVNNTRSRMATNALSLVHIIESLKAGLALDALQIIGKLINMEVPQILVSLAGIQDVPQFLAETKEPRSICVSVCTIHGAKGLEWNTVFVARVNEGVLPIVNEDGKNEDEERRLLYVAMTRARHKLFLSCSLTDERDQLAEPSRFLCESGVV